MKRQRRPIPTAVRATIDELVRSARSARNDNNSVEAWRCLEDAHVLSQPWVRPHVRVHLAMLSLGWAQRDRREIPGQLLRLVLAGPGSALGRYPTGNTGRSDASAFEPMPMRDDLAALLAENDNDTGQASDGEVLDAGEVRTLYDRVAPFYDIAAAPYAPFGGRRLAHRAIDELHLAPGETVVDLGTGTGWNLPHLSNAVGPTGHVIGVDVSPGMLDRARRRINRHHIDNVELVEHDIATYEPPTPPNGVVATFAIEMLPNCDDVIRRYITSLAPKGRIVTTGLRHPERWPEWLITLGTALMRVFGVSDAYRNHRPWETIQTNTDNATYTERFAGANYLAAGTRLDELAIESTP